MPGIFSGHNPEIIYEFYKQFIRQGRFKIENYTAKHYDQLSSNRESPIGNGIFDRDHGSGISNECSLTRLAKFIIP